MADFEHLRGTLAGPVADLIISTWQELASTHVGTGFYGSYLAFNRMSPAPGLGPLSCAVANTAPHAAVLEEGHAGYHLPSVIDWGAAEGRGTAHRTKAGRRFLRIPFRHGTPGTAAGGIGSARLRTMMPATVYHDAMTALRGDRTRPQARAAAARLAESGRWLSRPYTRPDVPASLRLRALATEGHPGYTWRSHEFAGMVRREQTNPVSGRSSGAYMTFRTLTEDSVGWWVPPMAGYHFAAQTVDRVRDQIRELVGEAARADVVDLIRVQVEVPTS